jgi:copper transport protein
LRGSVIADVLRTRFGELWAARAVLLVVLAPVLHRLDRFDLTSTRARVGAGAMGAVLILTLGLAGHAGTGMLLWLAVPADLVHVGAMCLWVGGLAVLALRVLAPRPASLEPAVARFSRLALACVAALVATGLFRAWRQVGSVVALTSTDYGHLLIAKTAAVVVVVLIATRSRDLVRSRVGAPRDLDAQPLPVGPGAARAEPDRETKRRLRKLVGVEVVVVAVVLAITAVLVSAQPARTAVNRPFTALVKTPKVHWDVLVTPGREGRNDFHVTALKPSGVGQDVLGMTLELRERDRDIGPIDLKLTRLGPGHYFSPGVDVPFTGHWELDMKVRLTPFEEATGTVDVPIRR